MIKGLAYVGLGVADVSAWIDVATSVFGLQLAEPGPGGVQRLRMDDAAWRIAVEPSSTDDLLYVGFEVDDRAAAQRIAAELAADGSITRSMSPTEAEIRGVSGGQHCVDPDGLPIELIHGPARAPTAFTSGLSTRFVTGPLGMGHLVVTMTDTNRTMAFYSRLGMRVSDYIIVPFGPVPEVTITFLHCNARHHTLGLLPFPMPRRLNHLMVEVDSVDEVIRTYYRAMKRGLPLVRHLGRHTNDRMLSFYARTPGGFDIEFGCDGVQVGDGWEVRTYGAISTWGHDGS